MNYFDPTASIDSNLPTTGQKVLRVIEVEHGTAKTSGEGYLRCKVAVLAAIDLTGATTPEPGQHVVSTFLSFSPKAAAMLGKACLAVGVRERFDLDSKADCNRVFVGKVFIGEIQHEDYRGEKQAKLGGSWRPAGEDVLSRFPHLTRAPGSTGPAAASGSGQVLPAASTEDGDDIPF